MIIFKFLLGLHLFGAILVPFFLDWGRISFAQVMILESWFMLWVCVLEMPTGALADFLGRKFTLVLAAIANMFAVIIYASYPNFYVFLAGEFVWAISASLMSGADAAFVYDTLKEIKKTKLSKKIFGKIESFKLLGILVAIPIGSVIAANIDLRAPLLLTSIPCFFAALVAFTFKEPRRSELQSKNYFKILIDVVKFLKQNRILKILALDMIVIAVISYLMVWLYQVMLNQAGVNVAYYGFVGAAFVIVEILLINNYGKLERILRSKKRLIFLTSFITGVMFVLGGLTTFIPLVVISIIFSAGIGLGRAPLFSSYLNKYIPSAKRATTISAISMIQQLALVVVYPIVGFLVTWSLNYTLIIIGVIAIVFSFLSRVEEKHLID
ncbi:MAG: MFS transporter [Candidatus Aenigmatarchaeota archaeon]